MTIETLDKRALPVVGLIALVVVGTAYYFGRLNAGPVQRVDLISATNENNNDYVNLTMIRGTELIFVGGAARSGTTLMRAILDVHSRIRCGPETRIAVTILQSVQVYLTTGILQHATSLSTEDVDDSVALFLYNIIANNGPRAERYCMKDPPALANMTYLRRLFPKAKFVYLVRDGRAVVHSKILKRKENMSMPLFKKYLAEWNDLNELINSQCQTAGSGACLMVKYEEDLILRNEPTVRRVVDFLGEKWEPGMLEHEKFVGSEIYVPNNTWSADQVKRPIYNDSLTSWMPKIPYLNESETRSIAPMLVAFNYNLTFAPAIIREQKNIY